MTLRVKRPNGDWDEIAGGRVDYHDRGGALHVNTDTEPVFFDADQWEAFEVVPDEAPPLLEDDGEERTFPEGFV